MLLRVIIWFLLLGGGAWYAENIGFFGGDGGDITPISGEIIA